MNIEKDIFKKYSINTSNLEPYGFIKIDNHYKIEKIFFNNEFKAIIIIDNNNNITGSVIDLQTNEEYLGLRTEANGEFANKLKKSYIDILIDIRNNCFTSNYYIFAQSNRINNYIKNKYQDNPEFLWKKFPGYGVYRNKNNNKWYSIIMNLDFSKLDNKTGEIEIINVKLNENKVDYLLKQKGYYKAYHMKKTDWISVLLNDTLKDEEIFNLIDESYNFINKLSI